MNKKIMQKTKSLQCENGFWNNTEIETNREEIETRLEGKSMKKK